MVRPPHPSTVPDSTPRRTVGLMPAAGRATRLAPLPCSKELLPVGYLPGAGDGRPRPKPVALYLLEQMRRAGATELCVVLRSGKWDIADYLGDGARVGMRTAFLVAGEPWGPPFSAAQAVPFVADADVVFGFPDLLLHPPDALARVAQRLRAGEADVVLGLCPMARAGAPVDVVTRSDDGRVTRLVPKEDDPPRGPADWAWTMAAWRPRFTAFLGRETARLAALARAGAATGPGGGPPEWPFGAIVAAAIDAGLRVDGVGADDWSMLDTGTPAGQVAAASFPGVWDGRPTPAS